MRDINLRYYKNNHSFKSKAMRAAWNFVWATFFRTTFSHGKIANAWRILLLRLFGATVGRHCVVKPSCEIWQPWKLEVGDYVALDEKVVCYTVDTIRIGSHTTVSREAFLCSAGHDIRSVSMGLTTSPISIGNKCWVAARAILMPGVILGEGVVIGAGAVVAKSVEPWSVVVGSPGRIVGKRIIGTD